MAAPLRQPQVRVTAVRAEDGGFTLDLSSGGRLAARAAVAATGTFGRPHRPRLSGLEPFAGTVLHAAGYRRPEPLAGQRITVVGVGNSAVQIAAGPAGHARGTLAGRHPVRFARQHTLGCDLR